VRFLILSDIHGNWEALDAALGDAGQDYDAVLCCGDLVGYGADPNRVVEWTREHVKLVVRGNHDRACAGLDDLEWFNPVARAAATWTGQNLTAENLEYLRGLPRGPAPFDAFQILHGSPLDEDDYLVSTFAAAQVMPYLDRQISFFGHTHLQGGFLGHRNGVKRLVPPEPEETRRVLELEHDTLYLINPGSIGQPRDGDPRAAYLIYEPETRLVEYRRVTYDIRRAQEKIREAGLPELLADRLDYGN
jgi:predicted phosphodiesterase